jgi:hypothetical protein
MLFGYTFGELSAAIISVIYLAFAVVMLFIIPPVGFMGAVIALVGPLFAVIGVFEATEHSPGDLQKALEALKGAAFTAVSFYVAVPASAANVAEMLITGVVMAMGVVWVRKGKVSRTAVT